MSQILTSAFSSLPALPAHLPCPPAWPACFFFPCQCRHGRGNQAGLPVRASAWPDDLPEQPDGLSRSRYYSRHAGWVDWLSEAVSQWPPLCDYSLLARHLPIVFASPAIPLPCLPTSAYAASPCLALPRLLCDPRVAECRALGARSRAHWPTLRLVATL